MPIRRIGRWVINWCWYAEVEDHEDGTCTILKYDRSRNPPDDMEYGYCVEDRERNIVAVYVNKAGKDLRVRNVQNVFSYPKFKD